MVRAIPGADGATTPETLRQKDCGVDLRIWRVALQAMPTEGDGTGHRPMPKLSGTGTDGVGSRGFGHRFA